MKHFLACATAAWRRAFAASVFILALAAERPALAGTVFDCGDTPDATTSLRVLVKNAVDSEVIDVSGCSTIILLQGAISTALDLTIQGPPDGLTTIDAHLNDRAFVDTGATQLILNHLLIEHGRIAGSDPNGPIGGCVLAANQVILQNSTLSDCAATTNDGTAKGGAVNADTVTLTSSVIEDSTASSANLDAQGGGAYAGNTFSCTDSLLIGNSAIAGDFLKGHAYGGGFYSNTMSVTRCAIVGNQASDSGGGIWGFHVFMTNSTVSGNSVTYKVGGIAASSSATISNSTIAFNQGSTCGGLLAPTLSGFINSTILANNTATTATACHDVSAGFGAGTDNIVGVADDGVTLPAGTYVGDPQLTPLANHGGPSPTHALLATSHAVDNGNNDVGSPTDTDQRGTGFARVVNGIADIGAYERQIDDDEIFYSGME